MVTPRNPAAARAGVRNVLRWGSAVWLAASSFGCGARAQVEASPDEPEVGASGGRGGAGGRDGAGGRGGAGNGGRPTLDPGDPLDLEGVVLPDCEPGFSMSAAGSRECTYLYQGDCYEDPLMACACACQRFADNRCIIGGFLNPDAPQSVSCVER